MKSKLEEIIEEYKKDLELDLKERKKQYKNCRRQDRWDLGFITAIDNVIECLTDIIKKYDTEQPQEPLQHHQV